MDKEEHKEFWSLKGNHVYLLHIVYDVDGDKFSVSTIDNDYDSAFYASPEEFVDELGSSFYGTMTQRGNELTFSDPVDILGWVKERWKS